MARGRTLGRFLLAGLVFGVLVAVIKGQDTGVRDALGNTSAPWIVLPFLAGTRYSRVWKGALVGLAVTLVSLLAFYAAEAAVLDLGAHPWYVDLRLTLGSGRIYETWGIFSGLVYGGLGALWASRSWLAAGIAVGLAFVCEPLIVFAVSREGVWGGGELLDYPWLWLAEVGLGLAAIALAARARAPVSRRVRP